MIIRDKSTWFCKILLSVIHILLYQNLNAQDFFNTTLSNTDNKTISFSDFKKNKATVIILLLSDCPASQSYTLTLNNLAKKYSVNNISFAGIFPGKYSSDDELRKFQQQYKVTFPLLKDPEMILSKKLGATIAPECFLINQNGNIVYKGRIDDWLYAIGKKKMVVTENNLDDAINAVIKNLPVKISETKPIGCILEYDK